jgi:hypothetical protein
MAIQNPVQKWSFATILFFCFTTVVLNLKAQNFCKTRHDYPNALANVKENDIPPNCLTRDYTARIAVHIIRQSNGAGGMTTTELNQALSTLSQNYMPHGIYFQFMGSDFIDNDDFFFGDFFSTNTLLNSLFTQNSNGNAIDIYIGPRENPVPGGIASGIPGVNLYVGGVVTMGGVNTYLAMSPVLSHEMGHCLGLFHTFQGTFSGTSGCSELVNGSNCDVCGDYVCDTPADPVRLFNFPLPNCEWTNPGITDANSQLYNPDEQQIMAYTFPQCMNHFSDGQKTRMKQHIAHGIGGIGEVFVNRDCTWEELPPMRGELSGGGFMLNPRFSQAYVPLLNNSTWLHATLGFEGMMYQYFVMGNDTLIDNKTYSIVKVQNYFNQTSNSDAFFLRENSMDRKVYMRFKGASTESLIYDFSLNLGNNLPTDPSFLLTKIDSVMIQAGKRRRFIFEAAGVLTGVIDTVIWVEGVGNLIHPFITSAPKQRHSSLLCNTQNNQTTYEIPSFYSVTCANAKRFFTKSYDLLPNSAIQIYPNPVEKNLIIQSAEPLNQVRVWISDISGKIVQQTSYVSILGQSRNILNTETLQTGLYFLTIQADEGRFVQKFIKQN